MLHHLKISAPTIGEPPTIELDGQPMGDKVRAVTLHMEAGSIPTAKLEYFTRPVEFEGMVKIVGREVIMPDGDGGYVCPTPEIAQTIGNHMNDATRWRQLHRLVDDRPNRRVEIRCDDTQANCRITVDDDKGMRTYAGPSLHRALANAVKFDATMVGK